MKTDTHSDSSVDRNLDRQTVAQGAIEEELQRAIDSGVIDWEDETEQRFFASQRAQTN